MEIMDGLGSIPPNLKIGSAQNPISGAYREAFPSSYRGWTIPSQAYPAHVHIPLASKAMRSLALATSAVPVPPVTTTGFLRGNRMYYVGAAIVVAIIAGIWYFSKKTHKRFRL